MSEDLISKEKAYEVLTEYYHHKTEMQHKALREALDSVPSAESEPLSDAYAKAVWIWLLDYQLKALELNGRYTPYEVLSWVANDWRKEHGHN